MNLFVLTIYLAASTKFKNHPYPLIAITSAIESFYYFTVFMPNRICQLNMAYLFTWSKAVASWRPWSEATSPEQNYKSLLFLQSVQLFINDLSMYLNLYFNSVIFIDLFMTLRNPFYAATTRIKMFFLFAVLQAVAIIITFGAAKIEAKVNPGYDVKDDEVWYMYGQNVWAVVTFFVSMCIMFRLLVKGTPDELRKVVVKQHMLYLVFYLIFILWSFKTYIENKWGKSSSYIHWITNSVGFFLACVRFSEPFIWNNFKADIKRLFCRLKMRGKIAQQPLNSFLNSAMNAEYVYMLLVGINFHLDPMNKVVPSSNKKKKLRI